MQNLKPLVSLYSWAGQFESYLIASAKSDQILRCPHEETMRP